MRWWTAHTDRAVRLEDGDIRLTYDLGESAHIREEDRQGRSILEAFTAIPFRDFSDRLPQRSSAVGETSRLFPELSDFVEAFGPVGADWGSEIEVAIPPVLLRHDVGEATIEGMPNLEGAPQAFWVVKLDWLGPGRTGEGRMERRYRLPGADNRTRARYDQSLPSDHVGRLAFEQQALEQAIDLADALARHDQASARAALADVAGVDGLAFPLGPRAEPSLWADAHRGPRPFGGAWHPYASGQSADWLALGRRWLAMSIDQRLNFTKSSVEVDESAGLHLVERATTLLEVIYRQLLAQVIDRPEFGFGLCLHCRGRVIRTRRQGPKANRWHRGCKESGRKRERRQATRTERAN